MQEFQPVHFVHSLVLFSFVHQTSSSLSLSSRRWRGTANVSKHHNFHINSISSFNNNMNLFSIYFCNIISASFFQFPLLKERGWGEVIVQTSHHPYQSLADLLKETLFALENNPSLLHSKFL